MSLYGGGDYSSPEMGYPNDAWDLTSEDIQELDRYIRHEESWDPLVDSLQYMDLQEQFGPIKYGKESFIDWRLFLCALSTVRNHR